VSSGPLVLFKIGGEGGIDYASLAFAGRDRIHRWPKAALRSGQPGKDDGGRKTKCHHSPVMIL